MANTRELQNEAEILAEDLRVALYNLKKKALDKSSIIELETTLLSAINKLPDNAETIVYKIFVLHLTTETDALKGLTTKAALIAKAKELIELAKYNQNRLTLLTEADPKNPHSAEGYFKKIYYHGSKGKNNPDLATKLATINVAKADVSKLSCSLDQLLASHLIVDTAIKNLNDQFNKFRVIDPLLTAHDPKEKTLLTALLQQHENAIKHPSILQRIGQFFSWSVPRKIEAGKTYTVNTTDPLSGRKVKNKVRLTNNIIIQHEAIFNAHTMQHDLSPRFRIISNQKPLGKGVHGTTYACVGTIKLRGGELESKQKSTLIIKEMHQHYVKFLGVIPVMVRDTPAFIQNEVDFLRRITAKAKAAVFQKRTVLSADSYVIDERFNGVKLSDLIEEQTKTPAKSKDLEWLTKVTSTLLYNLQHIHTADFIHHDVWTDNIMVNDAAEARIIDFGSAMNTSDLVQCGGRHEYRPPEKNFIAINKLNLSFRPLVDQSSDIYMLGKSLVELWSTNDNVRNDPTVKKLLPELIILQTRHKRNSSAIMRADKKARNNLEEKLNTIIKNNEATTPVAKTVVKLATMMNSNRKLRPSLEDIITDLEDIRTNGASPANVKTTFKLALDTHAELLKLRASKSPSISNLGAILNNAIDKLVDDSPDVLKQFSNTIKIKAFVNLNSKDEMKDKTNNIIKDYSVNMQKLLNLHNQVSASLRVAKSLPENEKKAVAADLTPLLNDINHRIHKSKCPMTLDDLHAFNEKMAKEDHLNKLDTQLADFDTCRQPKEISTQCKILRRLSLEQIDVAQVNKANKVKLKNAVKGAVRSYMQNEYADRTRPKPERLKQIENVLNVLENTPPAKTVDELETAVKAALGTLPLFARGSKLHSSIKDAMKISKRAR